MNRVRLGRFSAAFRTLVVALAVASLLVLTPSTALAQKKKKQEEAAPTKSYVASYFITIMMVSVGLMTICRPGKRKDRPDEKPEEE
jgi:uncharacterized membrane protein YdfJ with MMPL/SSD domain